MLPACSGYAAETVSNHPAVTAAQPALTAVPGPSTPCASRDRESHSDNRKGHRSLSRPVVQPPRVVTGGRLPRAVASDHVDSEDHGRQHEACREDRQGGVDGRAVPTLGQPDRTAGET
jgi:hypothetical protein